MSDGLPMQRPVDKYLFNHPEIWEQNNQARFDREPPFLAELFQRYGSVERVLDVGHLDRRSRLGLTGTGVNLNEFDMSIKQDGMGPIPVEAQSNPAVSATPHVIS